MCPGSRGIALARVDLSAAMPRVVECAFHPAPEITPALIEKTCKAAQVSGRRVTTLLAPGDYQMLLVEAPSVPADELKTAIRWRIKDMLNYHIDDAAVDVLQIPTGRYGGGRQQSIFAVAAPNVTIRKRIELFEKAGIELDVIDIPEMAQRNVAALFEENEHALALMGFNQDGGLLTVTAGGELYLSRRIEITSGQLRDVNEALRNQNLERVELEVQRSLDYVGRQYHYLPLRKLIVAADEDIGLEARLAEAAGLPVERLQLAQVMDISAVPDLARGEFAAEALHPLGAAMRQEARTP